MIFIFGIFAGERATAAVKCNARFHAAAMTGGRANTPASLTDSAFPSPPPPCHVLYPHTNMFIVRRLSCLINYLIN